MVAISVVTRVLEKEIHVIGGQALTVTAYQHKSRVVRSVEPETIATVEVKGCRQLSDQILEMYFENNKKSGGDDIEKLLRCKNRDIVLITFKESCG